MNVRLAAITVILTLVAGRAAAAAIVVGLVVDPAMTAGASPDVSSIHSGPGTWHLFAVDDNVGDFGISTYNVQLAGATTIRNTSPLACQIQGSDGSIQQAGFNILRSPNGSPTDNWIHASQPLPDQSPFLFTGLGQETGNLAAKIAAAQAGATLLRGTTSPTWGNYNSISPLDGKNWLFLAEGTYNSGVLPTISEAAFTVFTNPTTFRSSFSNTVIVPEPITATLLTPEYVDHLVPRTLPNNVPAPKIVEPEPQPVVVSNPSIDAPPSPPPIVRVGEPELQPIIVSNPPIDAPRGLPQANVDPPLENQPLELPPLPPEPVYYDGNSGSVSTGDGATGVDHDGSVSFAYQPIDLTVPVIPYEVVPIRPHGLQTAMAIALAGLRSSEFFISDGSIHVAPSMGFASFNSLGIGLTDRLSIESAATAPEPAALALVGLAVIALGGLVRRRC